MLEVIGAGASLLGGLIGGSKAKKAAAEAARVRTEQANQYYDAAKFRPVGMTTRFGQSNYQQDANGNLIGADYELNPQFTAMQNRLIDSTGRGLDYADQVYDAGQGLFGMANQYLSMSPEQTAQQWMASQQNLVAPSRERGLAAVRNSVFNKGTQGLAVGATGARPNGMPGLGAANPEMEAYFNSIAQQDAGFASQAMQQGRDATKFGVGLFGQGMDFQQGAYTPYKNMMSGITGLEEMGMKPLQMGIDIGGQATSVNSAARMNWANLMSGANASTQQANSYSPFGTALSSIGSGLSSMASGGQTLPGLFGMNSNWNTVANPATQTGGWYGTPQQSFFHGNGSWD